MRSRRRSSCPEGEHGVRRGTREEGERIPLRDGTRDGRCRVRGAKTKALGLRGGVTESRCLSADCRARASF